MGNSKCSECIYNQGKYCKYFEISGEDKKLIPLHIINNGCRFYKDTDPLVEKVIEIFNGTFI